MNVIQIVPHIHNFSSGPSHTVPSLSKSLVHQGVNCSIACLSPGRFLEDVEVNAFPDILKPKSLGISPKLYSFLKSKVRKNDIVFHNHSFWMFPNMYPGLIKRKYPHVNLMVAPRGTLSTYALNYSKLKKNLVWPLQKYTLELADCFHATAANEYDEIRALGYEQPVAIIPNGVDIPDIKSTNDFSTTPKKLLYLGRIHPKKGIDQLLNAWSKLEDIFKDWTLHIVGPLDTSYADEMQRLSNSLNCQKVFFEGEAVGKEKSKWYRKANLFVLPTHSENFGIVVAEALSFETPVIVTNEAPWEKVNEIGCGWCIKDDRVILTQTLEKAMGSKQLSVMGEKGRKWMQAEFSWDAIGAKMEKTYHWMLNKKEKPKWIRTD